MCVSREWRFAGKSDQYALRNDSFGDAECIANNRNRPEFRVTRSTAHRVIAGVKAFPEIYLGCQWLACSARSALPARVRTLRKASVTWYTRDRARGTWNTAVDIRTTRHYQVTGEAATAEIMIWIDYKGVSSAAAQHWPIYHIDGVRWYLEHWRTCYGKYCWNYVQFRRLHRTTNIRYLRLWPFLKLDIRLHLVSATDWAQSIAGGNEIWSGGIGLGTAWFSIRGLPKHRGRQPGTGNQHAHRNQN
jgi:cellulose 1,4-beta-cellobiosidase